MAKKVSVVEHEKEAVYKVYFCDRGNKQKNHELNAGAKLVENKELADFSTPSIIISNHQSFLDILITVM